MVPYAGEAGVVASSSGWVGVFAALSVHGLPLEPSIVECFVDVGTLSGEEFTLSKAIITDGQTVEVSIGYPALVRIRNGGGQPAQLSVSIGTVGGAENAFGQFVTERASNPTVMLDFYGTATTADQRQVEFEYLIVDCRLKPRVTPPAPRALQLSE